MGHDEEEWEAFAAAMDRIKGVLDGDIAKPGGPKCTFPNCSCHKPWTHCEKDERNERSF